MSSPAAGSVVTSTSRSRASCWCGTAVAPADDLDRDRSAGVLERRATVASRARSSYGVGAGLDLDDHEAVGLHEADRDDAGEPAQLQLELVEAHDASRLAGRRAVACVDGAAPSAPSASISSCERRVVERRVEVEAGVGRRAGRARRRGAGDARRAAPGGRSPGTSTTSAASSSAYRSTSSSSARYTVAMPGPDAAGFDERLDRSVDRRLPLSPPRRDARRCDATIPRPAGRLDDPRASRTNRPEESGPPHYDAAMHGERRRAPSGSPRPLVIRDQILAALARRARRGRLPRAAGRRRADAAEGRRPRRLHHQRRPAARQAGRAAAARRRRPSSSTRSSGRAPPHLERVEIAGPGFLNFFLAPTWLHEVLRAVVAQGERYGHGHALDGPAHQPRVRVGQPHRAAARRRRALGRGRRRDRQPARGAGREVHREYYLNDAGQPARHVRARRCIARYRGRGAARGRLPGRVPRRDGRASCGPSSATTSPRSRRASGATATIVAGAPATTSAASACTSTRGSPSARCTSAGDVDARARRPAARAASCTSTTAPRGCAPTDFGDQRDRVLVKSDGATTYLLQRPRVPPRQVRPRAGSTSSTSGAPTTTAR